MSRMFIIIANFIFTGFIIIGELETDGFLGMVNKGFKHHDYPLNTAKIDCLNNEQYAIIGDSFMKETSFMEHLPVWTNREYSMPRNLAKIYKDYILPVFYDNNITIKNLGDTAETKLLSAVSKSKKLRSP